MQISTGHLTIHIIEKIKCRWDWGPLIGQAQRGLADEQGLPEKATRVLLQPPTLAQPIQVAISDLDEHAAEHSEVVDDLNQEGMPNTMGDKLSID